MNSKLALLVLSGLAAVATFAATTGDAYLASIQQWRQQHEAGLKADDGWLTVTGLFWLKEGANRIGTAPVNDVLLPDGSAPGEVGTITIHGNDAHFEAAAGAKVSLGGKPVQAAAIRANDPDGLAVNHLKLLLLKRGDRFALRLKDNDAEQRKNFTGLRWYPVKPQWRVEAKFVAYPQPAKLLVDNVIGDQTEYNSPGYVQFERDGKEYNLLATTTGHGLFIVFRDLTSGKETYGSSRFLYTDEPKDGTVVLDFNKAENPPCAFTSYATCPLPVAQNRLSLAIPAGELKYGSH